MRRTHGILHPGYAFVATGGSDHAPTTAVDIPMARTVIHYTTEGRMNAGELIIILLRLVVPLLILRRPLVGGIAAMLLDGLDVVLIELIPGGSFGDHYHTLDKILDSYYLTLELIVALRWKSPYAKWPAIFLFGYRAIGVVLFELTERRIMLFIFPNLFENWWLYVLIVERFWPKLYPHSVKSVAIPMLLLLIPKMAQEYVLHFAEAKPWNFLKQKLGWN